MSDRNDESREPHWLRLAATLRAEPDPATLARVHARLAARARGPAWVRWLSHPVALAASAALLLVSVYTGRALLSPSGVDDETSVVSTLLGDDGSYGVPLERGAGPADEGSGGEGDSL